jgi:hypothetical protein
MSNLTERQHLDPEEGDELVIPKSFWHRDMGECALNIGDTDVADTIMGHLPSDPAENRATLAVENAFRSVLGATAAIRERPTGYMGSSRQLSIR